MAFPSNHYSSLIPCHTIHTHLIHPHCTPIFSLKYQTIPIGLWLERNVMESE